MAGGITKRQERYYREKIIKDAANEITAAGLVWTRVSPQAIQGEGWFLNSYRLNASNGEAAILLRVTGERAPEIKKLLRLWY